MALLAVELSLTSVQFLTALRSLSAMSKLSAAMLTNLGLRQVVADVRGRDMRVASVEGMRGAAAPQATSRLGRVEVRGVVRLLYVMSATVLSSLWIGSSCLQPGEAGC